MKKDKFEKPVCHKETFNGGLGKIIDRVLSNGCTFKAMADPQIDRCKRCFFGGQDGHLACSEKSEPCREYPFPVSFIMALEN